MRTEIDYVMPRRTQLAQRFLFQNKYRMIGGNSNAHISTPQCK